MAMEPTHRVERVPLRSVWPREQQDFSRWLSDESSIDAWLFGVEVILIAGSPEAALLTQIVGPSDLSRKAKVEFDQLERQRDAIEAEFGDSLRWDPLDSYRTSLICWDNPRPGGYRDDRETWPAVGDDLAAAMARLVAATQARVTELVPYEVVELEANVGGTADVTAEFEA